MLWSALQPENAPMPIDVTEEGIVMLWSALQTENAESGNEVSPVQFSREISTYFPEFLRADVKLEIWLEVVTFVTSMSYDEPALFVGKLLKAF